MVDMLIDGCMVGDTTGFIAFLNGEPDKNGSIIDDFYSDNSKIDESDYM